MLKNNVFETSKRWFTSRADVISVFLTFGIALYTVLNAENITSDMAGASLALALQISVLYQMFLRLCLEVNSRMSSAESIMKYAENFPLEDKDLKSEEKSEDNSETTEVMKPGEVELKNVSMKYRPELKYVLENISFKVEKGKHVGIVGRTGSGKSSLFTAFYHLADVIDGQIGINGQFNMPLSKRRQSLSLIPQDQ